MSRPWRNGPLSIGACGWKSGSRRTEKLSRSKHPDWNLSNVVRNAHAADVTIPFCFARGHFLFWNSISTGSVLLHFEDVDRAFSSWSFGHLLKNAKAGWRAARPALTTWRFMTQGTDGLDDFCLLQETFGAWKDAVPKERFSGFKRWEIKGDLWRKKLNKQISTRVFRKEDGLNSGERRQDDTMIHLDYFLCIHTCVYRCTYTYHTCSIYFL